MFNLCKKLKLIIIFCTVVFFLFGCDSKSKEGSEGIKPENEKSAIEKTESIQEKNVVQEISSSTPEKIV